MLAPHLYSSRLSEQPPLVRWADASPRGSPIASLPAWPAKQPATWPQSRLAHFPTVRTAPLVKYSLHTPTWFSPVRKCPPFAAPPRRRVHKGREPDSRWQSSRRSDPAALAILALLRQPWHSRASKSRCALQRIHTAFPAP